ncbi:MAG: hypothetical protein ABSG02_12420 [Terriglobales bacterium]|jgi:hypothetical protein
MIRLPNDPTTRSKERERAFLIGAPLAVIPALGFLPAVTFLIVFPRIAHGRAIGFVAVPVCALVSSFGLWKLALGAVQKPWGIFNVLSFGALIVLLVIAGYTGLFLALMTLKL